MLNKRMFGNRLALGLIVGGVVLTTRPALAFDHEYKLWDQVLQAHVADGQVDYQALKSVRLEFQKVVQNLESVTREDFETWSNKEKKAFWINAYNVSAIKWVLEHYPLKSSFGLSALRYPSNSIQQIDNVWDRPVMNVLGKAMSLNDIEHNKLRADFNDPRIHFAIVCASMGCPELRSEPYVSGKLDRQLDAQVERLVADTDKFRYDTSADRLSVSPIFKWFQEDFEEVGGIKAFLKPYVADDVSRKWSAATKMSWLDYDWSLNEKP